MESNVYSPGHYDANTADDIEKVIEGLPSKESAHLYNVLKYFERRNRKGQKDDDLKKANNSAHRLVYGEWRDECLKATDNARGGNTKTNSQCMRKRKGGGNSESV